MSCFFSFDGASPVPLDRIDHPPDSIAAATRADTASPSRALSVGVRRFEARRRSGGGYGVIRCVGRIAMAH
jgi:hypothetical protein